MKRPPISLDEPPSPERSAFMSRIRVRSTGLEKSVTSILKVLRYKFSRNAKRLPGTPDIVLSRHKKAIFVHGCFWHGHPTCAKGTTRPKTRAEFWETKISSNITRDRRVLLELHQLGWNVLTIWECQLRDMNAVTTALKDFLRMKSKRGGNRGN